MYKRLGLLLIAGTLLITSVSSSFADTVSGSIYSQIPVSSSSITAPVLNQSLTLNEAKAIAQQHSPEIFKAKLDYEKAMLELEQAKSNAKAIDADDVDSLSSAQTKYVTSKQKELAETVAQQTYAITKEQVAIQVEKSYFAVLNSESQLKVKEAALKRAQEQLNLVQKKYKAGSAIKTDVNKAEISVANAQTDIANAQRNLKNSQIALNQTLGIDVNSNLKLTYVLAYQPVKLPTVAELTYQALTNRLEIQKAKNNATISKLSYDWIVSYQSPGTYSARNAYMDLQKIQLDLWQQEQNVQAEVLSTLWQVEKADEVVQISAKSLQQAKDNQALAQRRYEIGVGRFSDVLSASVDLGQAEASYNQAVYDYTVAVSQLKTVIYVSN